MKNKQLQITHDELSAMEDNLDSMIEFGRIPQHLIVTAKEASLYLGLLREAMMDEILDPIPTENSGMPEDGE